MDEQEAEHQQTFDRLISEYRVRPTAMQPIWEFAGYAMGTSHTENPSTAEAWRRKKQIGKIRVDRHDTTIMPHSNLEFQFTGYATALLGKEAAMACTVRGWPWHGCSKTAVLTVFRFKVAVETEIGHHYNDQLRELSEAGIDDPQLREVWKLWTNSLWRRVVLTTYWWLL